MVPGKLKQLLLLALVVLHIIVVATINYPPSFEQITLGVSTSMQLWLVRGFSLAALIISAVLLMRVTQIKRLWLFGSLLLISPALLILWMSHPWDCLKLLVVSAVVFFGAKKKLSSWVTLVAAALVLLVINIGALKQSPSLLSAMSLNRSQLEVTARFSAEDSIEPNISLPLLFRRVAYNKYAILLTNTARQTVGFLDTESLFLEETHPLDTKSQIMLFWPELVLFAVALWLLAKGKVEVNKYFWLLVTLSFVNYLFSNDTTYKRLLFNLPLVIWVVTLALGYLWQSKVRLFRFLATFLVILSVYGFGMFSLDLVRHQEQWLDNRPYVYKELLTSSAINNLPDYDHVYVSDVLGQAERYCRFYIGNCSKFTFSNFDLSKEVAQPDSLYLGFVGNFYGSHLSNFPRDHAVLQENLPHSKVLDQYDLVDNVANKYGRQLLMVNIDP